MSKQLAVSSEQLRKGWEIRRANFSDDIYFYAPSLKRYETDEFSNLGSEPHFVPISITGGSCSLQCDHCQAKILKAMYEAKEPDRLFDLAWELKAKGTKGLLISGGSDRKGVVPLGKFIEVIRKIKEELGLKILVHTGLVDRDLAKGLAKAKIEAAMIDIIGSDQTIHDVYHLQAKVSDFEDSLKYLCEYGVKVAPHIVIGLHYGRINGEYKALETISKYPVACLVLVGLMPQIGTPMAEVTPPTSDEMGEIFCCARIIFSQIPVLLGCERAATKDKVRIEELAIKAGLNGIAYPTDGIVGLARGLGLKPHFSQICCALLFEELNGGEYGP
jgi:hypothetical protein